MLHAVTIHKAPAGRETTGDKLAAGVVAERNKGIDVRFPGPAFSIEDNHPRHRSRSQKRLPVAAVDHSSPGHFPEAVLARLIISQEPRHGTQQSKVMQGLNSRDP